MSNSTKSIQVVEDYLQQAKAYKTNAKWQEALTCYQKVMELEPEHWQCLNWMGDALLNLEQWEEAVVVYRRSLELNPNFDWAYHNLAVTLNKLGRIEEADAYYSKLAALNPEFWDINQNDFSVQQQQGDYLFRQQRWNDAVMAYRRTIGLKPNVAWNHVNLGRALSQLGQWDDAINCLSNAIQLKPNFVEAYCYQGEIQALRQDWHGAIEAYQNVLRLQPEQQWIKDHIGALRFAQGWSKLSGYDVSEALEYFEQIDQIQASSKIHLDWLYQDDAKWPRIIFSWNRYLEQLKPAMVQWPKITVVTPSFNQGEYLEETILSVLNQQYPNLEYILVDGKSTDRTASIIEQYRSAISAVIVEPDKGQSHALNKGFRLATGELLMWLNSDDILVPGALHMLALTYLKQNCDVMAGICLVHENYNITAIRKTRIKQSDFTVETLADIEHRWTKGHFFIQPEVCFSRRIFQQVGADLDESLSYAMDHDLWFRFAQHGARLELVNWPIALFRKHPLQKTANQTASIRELAQVSAKYHPSSSSAPTTKPERQKSYTAPNSAQPLSVYLEIGHQLVEQEKWADAIALYQRALTSFPESVELHLVLGMVQEKIGDFEGEIANYRKVIALQPDVQAWVYTTLGGLLSRQGHVNEAIDVYQQALKVYQQDVEIYCHLGDAQGNIGNHKEAIEAYQQALSLDPDSSQVHYSLGEFFLKLEQWDNAVLEFYKVIELTPSVVWAYVQLVDILIQQENWREAKHIVSRGLIQHPHSADLVARKIRILTLLGDFDSAKEVGLEELEQAPHNLIIQLELSNSLIKGKQLDQAYVLLTKALQTRQKSPNLLLELAKLEQQFGRYNEAERMAKEAVSYAPQDPAVALECSWIFQNAWKFSVAEEILKKALVRHPKHIRLLREYTKVAAKKVLTAEANQIKPDALQAVLSAYHQLIDLGYQCGEIHFLIADLLDRAGEIGEACHTYGDGIEEIADQIDKLVLLATQLLGEGASNLALKNLAPKELSQILVAWGNHYAATQRLMYATGCYRLARKFDAENNTAAFNLATVLLEIGQVHEAVENYGLLHRVYEHETSQMFWFKKNCVSWPWMTFGLAEHFETLKGPDVEWPKISIAVPSFNQVAYVEETLLSIFNQEYPNLEVIVFDAVSTDGTQEILKRYEQQITTLVIEPDKGQSNAINKAFHRSTGELLYWLNTDDMLAPGALFVAALTYLKTKCDLVAGICISHRAKRMNLLNRPAVRQHDFTVEGMSNLFQLWYKGHFFYQPEVLFSRRIWEKTGAQINESLNYTMDYDLWLRFASNGARIEVVGWPIGLFRQHPQQKTASFTACMQEQFKVRNFYGDVNPPFNVQLALANRLRAIFRSSRRRVAVVSARASRIFSADTFREIPAHFAQKGYQVSFHANVDQIAADSIDLVIFLVHIQNEHLMIQDLRQRGYTGLVVGWFWDNHHHYFENAEIAEYLDVTIPGHGFAQDGLRNRKSLLRPMVPLCTTQWTMQEAAGFFVKYGHLERSNQLHGGFTWYDFAEKRNRLIESVIQEMPDSKVFMFTEEDQKVYFGLSLEERFAQWAHYKTSLCLPLQEDLSQRLFDGLLAGQIPIVASDILDLDSVISPETQEFLPIIKFHSYDVESVKEAYHKAIARFDLDGLEGIKRRHKFALENHLFVSSITSMLADLQQLSSHLTR